MKKYFLMGVIAALATSSANAQVTDSLKNAGNVKKGKRDFSKIDISNRTSDHFILQLGYSNWASKPDSIRTKGFSRSFNMYFMLDKPFKTDPRFSIAGGVGIGSTNIFFEKTVIDIAGKKSTSKLIFQNADSINHYKKYKLVNVWAEVPIELRYFSNPGNIDKGWKVAAGIKLGTMLDAHTKGKEPQDKNDNVLSGQSKVVEKVKSKRFFNSTRIAGTFRVGYGHFSLYADYQLNALIKDGVGPQVKPYTIGLCLSGL